MLKVRLLTSHKAISFWSRTVWRTSTPEPTIGDGIIWTYLKDVTRFLPLFSKPGTFILQLDNLLETGLDGQYASTKNCMSYSHLSLTCLFSQLLFMPRFSRHLHLIRPLPALTWSFLWQLCWIPLEMMHLFPLRFRWTSYVNCSATLAQHLLAECNSASQCCGDLCRAFALW